MSANRIEIIIIEMNAFAIKTTENPHLPIWLFPKMYVFIIRGAFVCRVNDFVRILVITFEIIFMLHSTHANDRKISIPIVLQNKALG